MTINDNQMSNANPKIILGVTGGIAAYKSLEIVKFLRKKGADVQVVMTKGAEEFISPATFQSVSSRPVRNNIWDESAEQSMGHIDLARWADVVLIAPATAHCIGSLASGLAADLLTTLCLATEAPIIIVPAMNRVMWSNKAVQSNCELLKKRGVNLFGPAYGGQACGEIGYGRMMEPNEIVAEVFKQPIFLDRRALAGVNIMITAGPTREPIDPIRYITNRSSGKMGYSLALSAKESGAKVTIVSGPVSLDTPTGVRRIDVETADEMFSAVQNGIKEVDIFIGCAAVSDYQADSPAAEKIKRSSSNISIDLTRSPDILYSVSSMDKGPFTVGFAAETTNVIAHAKEKIIKKGLDMIAANKVGNNYGFDQELNALSVIYDDKVIELEQSSKPIIAKKLIKLIAERYNESKINDLLPKGVSSR